MNSYNNKQEDRLLSSLHEARIFLLLNSKALKEGDPQASVLHARGCQDPEQEF